MVMKGVSLTAVTAFLNQGMIMNCHALLPNLPNSFLPARTNTKTNHSSSSSFSNILPRITSLKGGYDSTIGINPSNPIQFFTFESGMCPYAARTLIVLNELKLEYDVVAVPPGKPDWYLKINPKGKVPSLRVPYHDNEVIYESAFCNEYLCDLYNSQQQQEDISAGVGTGTSLLPKNEPIQKARIRLLNDYCDTMLGPTFFTFLMNKDESKEEELKSALIDVLSFYEDKLKGDRDSEDKLKGGPYMNGQEFTLADVHVLPFFARLIVALRHFKNYDIQQSFPNLMTWFELCSTRQSVQIVSKSDEAIIEVYQKFIDMGYKFGGLNKN
jgi:glutathione S-transferase